MNEIFIHACTRYGIQDIIYYECVVYLQSIERNVIYAFFLVAWIKTLKYKTSTPPGFPGGGSK